MAHDFIIWFGMLASAWMNFWDRIDGNAVVACVFAVVGIVLAIYSVFRSAMGHGR